MTEYQLIKWGAIAAIAFLVLFFFFYSQRLQKKRAAAMKNQSDSLGYSYSERGDQAWLGQLEDFHLFNQGYSKTLSNIMTGNYNHLGATIMDYTYVTGGGRNSSTKKQTVLVFDSPQAILPDFELRPENLWYKISSALGKKDIDFPSYPQFSKHYLLKGNDEAAVRSMFTDGTLLYFEQNPGLCVSFSGHRFLFYRFAKLHNPADIPSFLQQGYDIYNLFKV